MLTVSLQDLLQNADAIATYALCVQSMACSEAPLPVKLCAISSSKALVGLTDTYFVKFIQYVKKRAHHSMLS